MGDVVQALEIRSPAGAVLDVVRYHYAGMWRQGVNIADVLRFTTPTEYAAHLTPYNEVWLRRGDDANLVRKFVITATETTLGARAETMVEALDYWSLLLRVPVSEFPIAAPEPQEDGTLIVPVLPYLRSLLALAASTGIRWGTLPQVTSDYTLRYQDLHVTSTNVGAALQNVRQDIGGMLWVDNDKYLHWYVSRFPSSGHTLTLDKNLISVTQRVDRITNTTNTTYSVDALDLSAHDITHDKMLMIGQPVTIPTPDGGTAELLITEIRQSLDNPLKVELSVNDTLNGTGRFRDLLDDLLDIRNDPDTPTNTIDTRLDDFDDWRIDTNNDLDTIDTRLDDIDTDINDIDTRLDEIDTTLTGIDDDLTDIDTRFTDVEQDIDDLETAVADIAPGEDIQPVGDANFEGLSIKYARSDHVHLGLNATLVAALPAIPTSGQLTVIRWGTASEITDGTGDGHPWMSWPGADRWYPVTGFTSLSGEVLPPA